MFVVCNKLSTTKHEMDINVPESVKANSEGLWNHIWLYRWRKMSVIIWFYNVLKNGITIISKLQLSQLKTWWMLITFSTQFKAKLKKV